MAHPGHRQMHEFGMAALLGEFLEPFMKRLVQLGRTTGALEIDVQDDVAEIQMTAEFRPAIGRTQFVMGRVNNKAAQHFDVFRYVQIDRDLADLRRKHRVLGKNLAGRHPCHAQQCQ